MRSADLMKLKFVRRLSAHLAIISEPNARISFLVVAFLVVTSCVPCAEECLWGFLMFFFIFLQILFVFVNMGPYGN